MTNKHTSLFFLASFAAACGGSGGATTDNEGVFAIQSWTLDEGCDGDPSDVASANPGFLGVANQEILGLETIYLAACADAAECDARVKLDYQGQIDATFQMTGGDDESGFDGFKLIAGTSFENETGCVGQRELHALVFDGATLRLDTDRSAEVDTEPNADGFCTTTAADEATADLGCSVRERIVAIRQ